MWARRRLGLCGLGGGWVCGVGGVGMGGAVVRGRRRWRGDMRFHMRLV